MMDIVLSSTAIIALAPFFIVIMIILKYTGEGEIFFLQPRVGRNGKSFDMIKFVTMIKDSPNMPDGVLTKKNDPRILPFGKILRKTKINELPQLINILIGDMSIVGPRPQAEAHFYIFPLQVRKEIVEFRPGLTGIGSVVFRNEESLMAKSQKGYKKCYQEDIAPYKGELELWYIRNQSLMLDLQLIYLTAWMIIFPNSAVYTKIIKEIPQKPQELSRLFSCC